MLDEDITYNLGEDAIVALVRVDIEEGVDRAYFEPDYARLHSTVDYGLWNYRTMGIDTDSHWRTGFKDRIEAYKQNLQTQYPDVLKYNWIDNNEQYVNGFIKIEETPDIALKVLEHCLKMENLQEQNIRHLVDVHHNGDWYAALHVESTAFELHSITCYHNGMPSSISRYASCAYEDKAQLIRENKTTKQAIEFVRKWVYANYPEYVYYLAIVPTNNQIRRLEKCTLC
jgi:hypothetical protein